MKVQTQNKDGKWVEAIPLPYFGLRKKCKCGKSFWTIKGYEEHYVVKHIYTN